MKNLSRILPLSLLTVGCLLASLLTSCIKNDIPYPRIQPNFTSFSVEDQSQSAVIDSINRIITLTLNEEADIQAVKVAHYTLSPGATVASGNLEEPLDLTKPTAVALKLYQEYWWVIKATQNIERYFSIAGQVGTSIIDVPAHRIIVTVPETLDLSHVKVTACKLGGPQAVNSPQVTGTYISLLHPYTIDITEHGRTETWTVYADITTSTVQLSAVDAWTCVAWAYAEAEEGKNTGFEYRSTTTQEWTPVPAAWVTNNGGSYRARIINLKPHSEYAVRAYSDDEFTPESVFTTGDAPTLPNSNFEYWWLENKKEWNPWPMDGEQWWGTGNKGATTLGSSNTTPSDVAPAPYTTSARLESRFVGIGVLGKLAAGNIFAGYYVKTDGTNGILSFGRPFTQRPTALHGMFDYTPVPISHTNSEFTHLKGEPDTCTVWVALMDCDEPFEIRTNPNNRQLFDPNGPNVVAYGNFQLGSNSGGFKPFHVELNYRSTSRVPNYILIAASSSKYGDYFTGGNGSLMYITGFELEYDY